MIRLLILMNDVRAAGAVVAGRGATSLSYFILSLNIEVQWCPTEGGPSTGSEDKSVFQVIR